MGLLQISFDGGSNASMTLEDAERIYKGLEIAVIVNDGKDLTFQLERGESTGSPTNSQRGI
jgi:hypothetical protein